MLVNKEELLAIIEDAVVSVDLDKLKEGMNFKECGVDSLEIMNIYLGIEEKYGIKIDDEDVDELNTLNALDKYLNQL